MKREKKSIKWRIFGYLLLFALILIALLWLFQIVYLDSFYRTIRTQDVKKALSETAEILSDKTDMEESIDEIAREKDLSILIMGQDGETLAVSEYMGADRLEAIPYPKRMEYYRMAKEQGGTARIVLEDERGTEINKQEERPEDAIRPPAGRRLEPGRERAENVIYVRIQDTNGARQVILMGVMLTPVEAAKRTLRVQLLWITGLLFLLSLGIATAMSGRVSKPIIRVNDSAKRLAKGDYSVSFEGRDYREIAELSDTLNYAAGELDKTEGFRRELLANVSHDLRTPLTMIIAYAEVMRDLPGENTPENIQVVIDESQRLTNLVNDMLDISKLQAGVMEKHAEVFNLTKSVESVLERYHKLKEQEGFRIFFLWEEEVQVEADEFKISQVIYNLVNNALNYTGKDQRVTVRQITGETVVRIEVEDTGKGIREEDLPYVWDRYYKVDKTHKRAVSGTGLGLSIVKNILELHGAEFGVKNGKERGTVFWFVLERAGEGERRGS